MAEMAKAPRFIDEKQKNFVKLYDGLCAKHGKWTVWEDFVMLSADSISTAFDKDHAEEREQDYMQRSRKYSKDELERLAEMLTETVNALESYPDQDFLGELFMSLGLSNEHNGQFFTPYHVCHFMSEICYGDDMKKKIEDTGWVTVNEPTCGSGAMLVAFANVCRKHGLNYQTDVLFVAQDIDPVVACMCYLQLSLLCCPGYVVIGNSLTKPLTSIDGRGLIPMPDPHIWYTPFYFRAEWHTRRKALELAMLFGELLNIPQAQTQPEPKQAPAPAAVAVDWSVTETGQLTFL